jgi:hypothetical protein
LRSDYEEAIQANRRCQGYCRRDDGHSAEASLKIQDLETQISSNSEGNLDVKALLSKAQQAETVKAVALEKEWRQKEAEELKAKLETMIKGTSFSLFCTSKITNAQG